MKILQVVADGSPGGGTTNVLALAEDLRNAEHEVYFASQAGSYANNHARTLGASVVDELDFFRNRIDWRIVHDLSQAVKRIHPDIIHVHGARAASAWIRSRDRRKLNRTFYTVRGYHFWRKPAPARWIAMRMERAISRAVFRTIHVCQDDQNSAMELRLVTSLNRCQVIRNGIRLSDIPRPSELGSRTKVVVLGRLVYQKNPHLVLDIASRLAKEGFRFHLVGGGEMLDEVVNRVRDEGLDNVIVHGPKSRDEGLKIMSDAGTFLMASRWEGLPIAPVEAMAMGLAVVISDVNGNQEVVRDSVEGRVVRSENLEGFISAIQSVCSEPAKTAEMIVRGRKRVAEEFTRERVVKQHLKIYLECCGAT